MTTSPERETQLHLEFGFGDRLRKLRRELGMDQKQFAKRIAATPAAVGAWELGTNEPRGAIAIAKRVERAFNVSALWLLGLSDDPWAHWESNPEPAGFRSVLVNVDFGSALESNGHSEDAPVAPVYDIAARRH